MRVRVCACVCVCVCVQALTKYVVGHSDALLGAIVVNDEAMQWGGNRVHVVALVAFSASGRTSFQHVFDQFVEVFSDRLEVQRLIKRSADFASFIDELVHLMDA